MLLSNSDVEREISKSLDKIEKGNLAEAVRLKGFLIMNGIDSPALGDSIDARYALGELARSNFIYKKYSSYLTCGIKKDVYISNKGFAYEEIRHIAERVADEHKSSMNVFNDFNSLENFLLYGLSRSIDKKKPVTLVYHENYKNSEKSMSEFVCFDNRKIVSGGLAHDWKESLRVQFFGKDKVVNAYRRELEWPKKAIIDYMSFGSEVNDINLTSMPPVNQVLNSIQGCLDETLR